MFETRAHLSPPTSSQREPYSGSMALSAHDVAAVLRDRLPGLATKKLHKLLYHCQGHHLVAFDEPLFSETISAWDMGPVVGTLWRDEKQDNVPANRRELSEAQLNTVGYVLSRYGVMSGLDLENLKHSETPWQSANSGRRSGESARIQIEWIRQYFRASGVADGEQDEVLLDSASVTRWLQNADNRRAEPARPDRIEELRARLTRGGWRGSGSEAGTMTIPRTAAPSGARARALRPFCETRWKSEL